MKPTTIGFWQGRLPHWEVEDGRYFVTVRLRGAIPKVGRDRIREKSDELRNVDRHNEEEVLKIQRSIFKEMEHWLHRSERVKYLENEKVAQMIIEAVEHRQQECIWNMFEYVVMPNHLHLFFETGDGHIKKVMEDFKHWTAIQANRLLEREGRLWQTEWFDHWSRSDAESEKIVRYIQQNPQAAGLIQEGEVWPYVGHGRRP